MPGLAVRRGVLALVLTAIGVVAALLVGTSGSSAIGLQATWSLTGRAGAAAFRGGPELPLSGQGFEVISFAGVGPTAALGTYRYGGPERSAVTCGAGAAAGLLTLNVGNTFPYTGCVFFPVVTNTGARAIEVDFGSLTQPGGVFCGLVTCRVDIVAGGTDEAGVTDRCTTAGTVARATGTLLTYRLSPGASITCPIFVVLLQPASEATTYTVTIDPPAPRPPVREYLDVGPAPPPVPGAAATPRPPRTGFGLVVGPDEAPSGDGSAMLAVVSFVTLLGAVLVVGAPRPRSRPPAELEVHTPLGR